MTSGHKHQSNIEIAAETLRREGGISTMRTIYEGRCSCGMNKRNTRLADTIHELRTKYGWVIATDNGVNGMLASYRLVSVGKPLMSETAVWAREAKPTGNSRPNGPLPEDVPADGRMWCPHDGRDLSGRTVKAHLLGGHNVVWCPDCADDCIAIPWRPSREELVPRKAKRARAKR